MNLNLRLEYSNCCIARLGLDKTETIAGEWLHNSANHSSLAIRLCRANLCGRSLLLGNGPGNEDTGSTGKHVGRNVTMPNLVSTFPYAGKDNSLYY